MGSEILLVLNRTKSETCISYAEIVLQNLIATNRSDETVFRSLFDMLINVAFEAEFSAETRPLKSLNVHLRAEK